MRELIGLVGIGRYGVKGDGVGCRAGEITRRGQSLVSPRDGHASGERGLRAGEPRPLIKRPVKEA